MDIKKIKGLLEKYDNAETTCDEERLLADYFNSGEVAEELLPYEGLFREFAAERLIKAPESAALKLERAQSNTKRSARIFYISTGIAASLLLLLSIAVFRSPGNKNEQFVMYDNGRRIDDPVLAMKFLQREMGKVSATFDKTSTLINAPMNTIGNSLEPLRKTSERWKRMEELLYLK